jgi:hypothetical protein
MQKLAVARIHNPNTLTALIHPRFITNENLRAVYTHTFPPLAATKVEWKPRYDASKK